MTWQIGSFLKNSNYSIFRFIMANDRILANTLGGSIAGEHIGTCIVKYRDFIMSTLSHIVTYILTGTINSGTAMLITIISVATILFFGALIYKIIAP